RLQGFANPLVQAATADGIELLVQDLANLVVGKGEAVAAGAVDANELGVARLVERVEQRILAGGGYGRQLAEGKDLAQRGGGAQRIDCGVAHAVEPPPDGFLDALRNGQLVRLLASPAAVLAI